MLHGVGKVVQQVSADNSYYTSDVPYLCNYITYMQFNTNLLHSVFNFSVFRRVSTLAIGHLLQTCAAFAPNYTVEILHI
jgi:hypothetical protein